MTLPNIRPAKLLGPLAAAVAALALIAGCGGGGAPQGTGQIRMDLGPIVEQLGGGAASPSAAAARTGEAAGPPASAAVTPPLALVVGAIVIDFQNTPIGPDTAITDAVRNNLKNAAENSVAFLTLVSLPTSSTYVDFYVPPPAATHWQIGVVGLRDSPATFTDIKDSSPIYYGFNAYPQGSNGCQALSGCPYFLTTSTVGSAPIDITMRRACLVSSPPNGCAQFDLTHTLVVTPAVEIVGVYLNGVATNLLSSSLSLSSPIILDTAAEVSAAQASLTALNTAVSAATSVQVDTTHMMSAAYTAGCTPGFGTGPGTGGGTCSVESYVTNF